MTADERRLRHARIMSAWRPPARKIRFYAPCPTCGRFQPLTTALASQPFTCAVNGCVIDPAALSLMVDAGEMRAEP